MNDPRVILIAAVPIALLFFFAVVAGSVFVKPTTALQWLAATLTLMIGGIATIWFGLRHDVSAVEAIASGALVVACLTVVVLIGRRARRVALRGAGDVWNPRRESNPRSAHHECPPVRVGPPRWMPPSQSEQDVFASPPQRRTA